MKRIAITTLFLLLTYCVFATDFVISKGQVQVGTFTLNTAQDTLLIEDGGVVLSFPVGVEMTQANQQVTNNGLISTINSTAINADSSADNAIIINNGCISAIGDLTDAIVNAGTSTQILNTGVVSTEGDAADVISNTGASTIMTNTGVISTGGLGAHGISNLSAGTESTITNYGLIATQNNNANGINNTADSSTLTNEGTITTLGTSSEGINNSGDNTSIVNSGAINTLNSNAEAVANSGDVVSILNSGSITAQGSGASAILSSGSATHLINSGTIRAVQDDAIQLTGRNPTLTLLRGSNIQGAVNSTSLLNTNVEKGLDLFLTLSNAGFGTLNIDAPFILVGNSLAVIDSTGFAMQSDIVADLSDTFLGGIYRHRTTLPCPCTPCNSPLWIEVLGSYRARDNSALVDYNIKQGGILIGIDCPYFCDNFSIFAGGSYLEAQIEDDTQKARVQTYIAGAAYETLFYNHFFGTTLIAGQTQLNNRRNVMNNLAPGGVEKARAFTRGFFLSPELTYAYQFSLFNCYPTLSGTVRYAGLFLGSYHETGSASNLSVKDRTIQLLTVREELGTPFTIKWGCFNPHLEPYVGVAGRFQLSGNHIESELLAQTLNFNSPLSKNILEGLVGLRLVENIGSCDVFLNVEGTFDNNASRRVLGEAGMNVIF